MFRHVRINHIVTVVLVAAASAVACSTTAFAATATQQVTAGSLSFINSTPGDVTFPGVTLDGSDKTNTQTQAFNVSDATGSNAGWNITATSTTFTSGGNTLPTTATTIQSAPAIACDGGVGCTPATNAISYPYTLPANTVAPTATKMFNASAATGMGNQTITPTWTLAIPASTAAGTYASTWTFTLVSGP